MRFREIRPWRTPNSCIIWSRFSRPGPPFGIFEKSSLPRLFCPSQRNAQWSVETTERTSDWTASQRRSWFSLARGGGV